MEDSEAAVIATNKKDSNCIHEDIMCLIMSKLPLKSLRRFDCLAKSFFYLFRTQYFKNIYRNNLVSNNHYDYDATYLVLQRDRNIFNYHCDFYFLSGERHENKIKLDWPPPFKDDDTGISILGSVSINGILCLTKIRVCNGFVLWNPTTNEFNSIQPSSFGYLSYSRINYFSGFGYDHCTNDYKVINFIRSFYIEDGYEYEYEDEDAPFKTYWEIYSLRSNCWRKLDAYLPKHYFMPKQDMSVYMDGVYHWWIIPIVSTLNECLMSFDFSKEKVFITSRPSYFDACLYKFQERCLTILNGSIALISNYIGATQFSISILGELSVKESWTNLCVVESLPSIQYPIGVGKSNIVFFNTKDDDKLVLVDLTSGVTEEYGVKQNGFGSRVGKYKKSFLPMRKNE